MAVDQEILPVRQRALKVVGAGSIRLENDVPLPRVGEEDVLVRVKCVALNPFDWKSLDMSPSPGSTFGCDVSGVVVALGSQCSDRLRPGDRVFGAGKGNDSEDLDNGGFAEYVSVREVFVWKIPPEMRFEEAATLAVALMTTGLALYHRLKLPLPIPTPNDGKGDFIFIYGGGTATGTIAIQCAALSGLRPITACSPRNFDRVKSLGAVACWDYHVATVADEIRAFTNNRLALALDCITDSASMNICYQTLGEDGGRYVGLDQFPIRSHTRRDVQPEWIIAWTMSGEALRWKRPYARSARPKHRAFGQVWNPVAQRLLDAGMIATHPIEVRTGGLASVPDGVDMVRKGTAGGNKFVYATT